MLDFSKLKQNQRSTTDFVRKLIQTKGLICIFCTKPSHFLEKNLYKISINCVTMRAARVLIAFISFVWLSAESRLIARFGWFVPYFGEHSGSARARLYLHEKGFVLHRCVCVADRPRGPRAAQLTCIIKIWKISYKKCVTRVLYFLCCL